jgi:serine/threonine protein kinase
VIPATIGRYQVLGEIGRGGMAMVYRAYDPEADREVAIKALPRELLHDPTFRARFRREVERRKQGRPPVGARRRGVRLRRGAPRGRPSPGRPSP